MMNLLDYASFWRGEGPRGKNQEGEILHSACLSMGYWGGENSEEQERTKFSECARRDGPWVGSLSR